MVRSAENQDRANDPPPADQRAVYYRLRAEECFRLAEQSANPELRDQWLRMGNQWTSLLIHNRDLSVFDEHLQRP
jgi:hypothetical protein